MLVQWMPGQENPSSADWFVHSDFNAYGAPALGGHAVRIAFDRISILISVYRHPTHDLAYAVDLATRGPQRPESDTVHVSVVSPALYDHLDSIQAEAGLNDALIVDPRFARDPAIAQLARALVAARDVRQDLEELHADAIGLAIVTRLLGLRGNRRLPATNRRRTALQKWRLKRVVDYVDGHLARTITLADLAAAAGLTRMHFAAQFKAATGVRPHDYILRRRIDRAQELLRNTELALVDVALSVGFQTQAHFTTVFRRLAGETPHRWRRIATGLWRSTPGDHAPEHAIAADPGVEQGRTEMRQDRQEEQESEKGMRPA
jgi:AraC-like DNA-binding protein